MSLFAAPGRGRQRALYTRPEMNSSQKWLAIGAVAALLLVLLFPPWRQTFHGEPLTYNEHLGRHFILRAPPPTGERSWISNAPASECRVSIEQDALVNQCGSILVMAG